MSGKLRANTFPCSGAFSAFVVDVFHYSPGSCLVKSRAWGSKREHPLQVFPTHVGAHVQTAEEKLVLTS